MRMLDLETRTSGYATACRPEAFMPSQLPNPARCSQ
jgi:hypothetical protein